MKDFLISHVKYNLSVVERILQEESDSMSTLFLVYSYPLAETCFTHSANRLHSEFMILK